MKKIMFNDRFGLTDAVIEKRKTVTRRLLKQTKPRSLVNCLQGIKYECVVDENGNNYEAPYYVGEIVAVAQCYCDALGEDGYLYYDGAKSAGEFNKMFVRADLMPHQIRILDVRAERLQDITDEDCLREGIMPYGSESKVCCYADEVMDLCVWRPSAKEAFASLIDKISGKGTWKANPYVWRIEFELVK